MALKYKISILDKIAAFSSEQDCKTKQQEIRELTAQKDRIEKLIVNIINDEEGYSKLHQIAKESVKAVLSDHKNSSISSFCSNNPDFKNRSTNG